MPVQTVVLSFLLNTSFVFCLNHGATVGDSQKEAGETVT